MDIEVFGIKLSDFIKAFKKAYDFGNGTYDYMSFLNDTDCATFCGLEKLYKSPNDVLNYFINPALKSIDVAGGKKRKMKGGAQQQYIFILILFLLAVSNVFAGPKYDELVREFGTDISSWPKEPGTQPDKPQNRWNGFIFTLGPSSQAQAKYNAELSKWISDKNRWAKFLPIQKSYEIEYESEQKMKESQIAVEQTKTTAQLTSKQAELQKTQTAETQAAAVYNAYEKLLEMSEKNAQLREQAGFWKGITIGGGTILGLLMFYISYMYNKVNRVRQISYQPGYQGNQGYRVDEPEDDITEGINNLQIGDRQRYPALGYQENRLVRGGGKTKSYRKKRTTKRKH